MPPSLAATISLPFGLNAALFSSLLSGPLSTSEIRVAGAAGAVTSGSGRLPPNSFHWRLVELMPTWAELLEAIRFAAHALAAVIGEL